MGVLSIHSGGHNSTGTTSLGIFLRVSRTDPFLGRTIFPRCSELIFNGGVVAAVAKLPGQCRTYSNRTLTMVEWAGIVPNACLF